MDSLRASAGDDVWTYAVEPLLRWGQLHEVDGGKVISSAPGIRMELLPTPGHTPGHQAVLLRAAAETVLFSGDAFVHAIQFVRPDVSYIHESDPTAAATARRTMLDSADKDRWFATPHLGSPFNKVGADRQ